MPFVLGSSPFTTQPPCLDADGDGNVDGCEIIHSWLSLPSWKDQDNNVMWTGFYGDKNVAGARYYDLGGTVIPPTSVGARVLGQRVDDRFGTTVSSDGTWLYIAAPEHTALQEDVPSLTANRLRSGAVYQLRTRVQVTGHPNLAQLWIEPGPSWPNVDAEIESRTDYTMPVPHQYIIETTGSTRGNYAIDTTNFVYEDVESCPKDSLDTIVLEGIKKSWAMTEPLEFHVANANELDKYKPYSSDTAGYYTDRTPQIVGPHVGARLSYVRGLGDVDGDGVRDFAVGSRYIEDPASPGTVVGALYIVYGRPPGLEGDYLLEDLHVAPTAPNRLKGVMLKGQPGGTLARVLDDAGNFDGDAFDDVIVGNETGNGGTGEAVLILGSQFLESPADGWTVSGLVADPQARAIRFKGENVNDMAGASVAGAGDVDGDGYSDILIAAPGYPAGAKVGAVYLVYGRADLNGDVDLANIGTVKLPGARFVGRNSDDQLGGGDKSITGTVPGSSAAFAAHSRGVAALGDIDGDGRADYAISAMLADPQGRADSGEVYILYGRGDPR